MSENLTRCVEQICMRGCNSVRRAIESLEQHQPDEVTRDLSTQECDEILHELKEIMAVYDKKIS